MMLVPPTDRAVIEKRAEFVRYFAIPPKNNAISTSFFDAFRGM
jgi:hypothetical protein